MTLLTYGEQTCKAEVPIQCEAVDTPQEALSALDSASAGPATSTAVFQISSSWSASEVTWSLTCRYASTALE